MRRWTAARRAMFTILLLVAPASQAPAIIRVNVSLAMIYKSSRGIIIAKVGSVDAAKKEARLRDAVTIEELGKKVLLPRDRTLALDLSGDASLARRLREGEPAVIFVGRRGGAIHVANAWFKASPRTGGGWRIIQRYAIARTFPGTTPSLIRALLKLRAGKAPLVDAVMHHTWHGSHKLQVLDVKAKAMASADADGDGRADLAVVTDRDVRFYVGAGARKAFTEATGQWGLAGATARQVGFADANGDRKPDLLLDELYLNNGSRFTRSKAGIRLSKRDVLAVALMDATGNRKPDALVLGRDGAMTIYRNLGKDAAWPPLPPRPIWKGGDPPLAAHIGDWGDDGSPHILVIRASGLTRYSLAGKAADLERLTGTKPMYRGKPRYFPMNDFLASAAWDRSGGDGNLDLHVVTRKGKPRDLELIGRGHGAFFLNGEAGTWIIVKRHPKDRGRRFQPRVAAMAPADMYQDGSSEMLILEEDGTLWQKDSPIYVRGKPIEQWQER